MAVSVTEDDKRSSKPGGWDMGFGQGKRRSMPKNETMASKFQCCDVESVMKLLSNHASDAIGCGGETDGEKTDLTVRPDKNSDVIVKGRGRCLLSKHHVADKV